MEDIFQNFKRSLAIFSAPRDILEFFVLFFCWQFLFSGMWDLNWDLENFNIYVSHLCGSVTLGVNLGPDLLIKSGEIY